jgi:hypothetical protein
MPLESPYTPVELNDAQKAFPADALDYMPDYETCRMASRDRSWPLQLQRDWMFGGLADIQLISADKSWKQPDIDRAFQHLGAIQNSYAPKHEHKEAAVAFLFERWFSHARWKVRGGTEWRGHWPEELTGEPCTNCNREVLEMDGEFRHMHTEATLCQVDDLRQAGLSDSEIAEQESGIATYSACPVPPADDAAEDDTLLVEVEWKDDGTVCRWSVSDPDVQTELLNLLGEPDTMRT